MVPFSLRAWFVNIYFTSNHAFTLLCHFIGQINHVIPLIIWCALKWWTFQCLVQYSVWKTDNINWFMGLYGFDNPVKNQKITALFHSDCSANWDTALFSSHIEKLSFKWCFSNLLWFTKNLWYHHGGHCVKNKVTQDLLK